MTSCKLFIYSFLFFNLSILTLSAREGSVDYRSSPDHFNYGNPGEYSEGFHGQNYNQDYRRNYEGYGNYGGYETGGGYWGGSAGFIGAPVYPYPPPGSQPGMSDDSNALYQSYLRKNGDSY